MALALTDEQRALAGAVADLVGGTSPRDATRRDLDKLAQGALPAGWQQFVDSGFLTLHLPEAVGGGGATPEDLAVVVAEAARQLMPGPYLSTALAGLVLTAAGGDALTAFGARIVAGAPAAVTFASTSITADDNHVSGRADYVLDAPAAEVLIVNGGGAWFAVDRSAAGVQVEPVAPLDTTRSLGHVILADVEALPLRVTDEQVRGLAAALLAAEASGTVRWCFEAAVDYVKVREQFGRAVGSFQAVKHKAAVLFMKLETITAAAWDASRAIAQSEDQLALAAAAAAIVALPGARDAALEAITLLGGIGFAWEHDIALYWRRATGAAQLLEAPDATADRLVGRLATSARDFGVDVADIDPDFRSGIAATLTEAAGLAGPERLRFLAGHGLVAPHHAEPYGLAATPKQQFVINQEFERAGIEPPNLVIAAYAIPTLLAHGTDAQKDRFVPASLRGEIVWCQLFSEPGAGSDLASLRTKADKVDGGWRITGQKVWTSKAHEAHWGMCLARTDHEVAKHKGISYFLVDMASEGIEIRPLVQTTGRHEFNEVFLNDVFVPDDCLVGAPGEGWKISTTMLGNERLFMAARTGGGAPVQRLIELALATPPGSPARARVGALVADSFALSALGLRALQQQLAGRQPGAETSAMKIAGTDAYRAQLTAIMELSGPAAAAAPVPDLGLFFDADDPARSYISVPANLLGGGTREIQLNVVAERVLGLPRG